MKAGHGQCGVANGVLDVLVSEVVLDGTGILAIICQLEARRMAQHVRVHGEAEPRSLARPSDHLPKRGGRERSFPLADKDIGCLGVGSCYVAQRTNLRAI